MLSQMLTRPAALLRGGRVAQAEAQHAGAKPSSGGGSRTVAGRRLRVSRRARAARAEGATSAVLSVDSENAAAEGRAGGRDRGGAGGRGGAAVEEVQLVQSEAPGRAADQFSSVEEALAAIRDGGYVVVVDDESRENEGDLIAAAECVSTQDMAFLLRYTSGIVCVALTHERCEALGLPMMVPPSGNKDSMGTAFTVSVDCSFDTTTGISASDRAVTVRQLAAPDAAPADFNRPGHIFPLRCREGGVLARPGHTEAASDLTRLAGCSGAGVLCELMNEDGSVQRLPQLMAFASEHGLPIITVDQLVDYRKAFGY
mmetsp:Transcript_7026/g.25905  ORF Transcript_7026/g.25905 Transcript_7026/m.25905 type:complete len:314 (-) Transcript_7026:271-1212(-)